METTSWYYQYFTSKITGIGNYQVMADAIEDWPYSARNRREFQIKRRHTRALLAAHCAGTGAASAPVEPAQLALLSRRGAPVEAELVVAVSQLAASSNLS